MERYGNLDLECETSVADRASMFGGMSKRSSKHVQPQDTLAHSELSNSGDSLNDNPKGVSKGVLGKSSTKPGKDKTPSQASLSVPSRELSTSDDSLSKYPSKEKTGVLGGILKRSPKPSHSRSESQDNFSLDGDLNGSSDSLSENNNPKEKGSKFGAMFKKSNWNKGASQDDLSVSSEKSRSSDNLSEEKDPKEKGGMFGGVFKKPMSLFTRSQSREDLTSDLSVSSDNLSEKTSKASLSVQSGELSASSDSLNNNKKSSKEKTGMLGGILKRTPKPAHRCTASQDNLSLDGDLSGSSDSLSTENTKEKSSKFGGMFKSWTKGADSQSQEDLSVSGEMSGSLDNLSEGRDGREKGGVFSGVFKKHKRTKSRDDLTADPELSGSTDNLSEKTSKGGVMGKILKNPFQSPWAKGEQPSDSSDKLPAEEPQAKKQEKRPESDGEAENADPQSGNKQNKVTGAMAKLNPFRSANKHEKSSGSDEEPAGDEKTSSNKQSAVAGAMAKMNPFRSANKKDASLAETDKEVEKHGEGKSKPVRSGPTPRERTDRSGPPSVPTKPAKEDYKSMALRKKDKVSGDPSVTARTTEEELGRTSGHALQKPKSENQSQSDDEVLNDQEPGRAVKEGETKATKMKKPKRHNPFMLRAAADKAPSDDEGLKEDEPSNAEEEGTAGEAGEEGPGGQAVATKPKKNKKHNPFLPRIKVRPKKTAQEEAAEENEGGNRSLFDRLEDLIDREGADQDQDVEGLMEWWSTVEQWEDMPQIDDMTEKEEAKAFALTAEKVQKGIRVFNKLFTERAESLWQHVIDLNTIADNLDVFNKKTKIAQITGGSTSAVGGVATIAGLALAPFTMGTSLIVTAVGLGVATAGGLTSAGAGISNQVNNSLDRKKVEKIVEDYQEKMADLNKCMTFIKQGIENLRKFDLLKMRKHAYNRDFPALNNIYEDGAMMGKAILLNANEIMRVVQIANVAGSTAARAVQIASMATGVLTGLFIGMDIYFVAKDSKELKKGAKSEFAGKIREVATQLHDGLVELNGIREELQSTTSTVDPDAEATLDPDKNQEYEEKKLEEDSDEDEIDRIKKAIKKDYENREYV